jgi:hypothetical protein
MALERGNPVIGQHEVARTASLASAHADRAGIPVEVADTEIDDFTVSTLGQGAPQSRLSPGD